MIFENSTDKRIMKPEQQKQSPHENRGPCDALCKVPVFRPVAIKLLSMLSKEDLEIFDIAEMLNSDPGFSAEFLTTASRPFPPRQLPLELPRLPSP